MLARTWATSVIGRHDDEAGPPVEVQLVGRSLRLETKRATAAANELFDRVLGRALDVFESFDVQ